MVRKTGETPVPPILSFRLKGEIFFPTDVRDIMDLRLFDLMAGSIII